MSALDRLFYSLSAKPAMDPAQRASLALSSMYSLIDGRADDSLARRCRHAGFLDEAEAWQQVLGAGRLARPRYSGWNEYGVAFLRGREVWAGRPDPAVAAAVGTLIDDERSMWRTTPWDALPA